MGAWRIASGSPLQTKRVLSASCLYFMLHNMFIMQVGALLGVYIKPLGGRVLFFPFFFLFFYWNDLLEYMLALYLITIRWSAHRLNEAQEKLHVMLKSPTNVQMCCLLEHFHPVRFSSSVFLPFPGMKANRYTCTTYHIYDIIVMPWIVDARQSQTRGPTVCFFQFFAGLAEHMFLPWKWLKSTFNMCIGRNEAG